MAMKPGVQPDTSLLNRSFIKKAEKTFKCHIFRLRLWLHVCKPVNLIPLILFDIVHFVSKGMIQSFEVWN